MAELSALTSTRVRPEQQAVASPPGRLRASVAVLLFVALLWLQLCWFLSNEWSADEQYSYGWFVPSFAAYLFWLRWQDKPGAIRSSERGTPHLAEPGLEFPILIAAVAALLLLLPVRLFEIAAPDWRPVGWLHAAVVIALTFTLVYQAGGRAWVRHFAFPILFIFVAVPWISAIETPLVQGLMKVVARAAAELATWFGIPTQVNGNLIRLQTGVVGINEACSGVRSLQTAVMLGLLFGELKRLSIARRLLLLLIAVSIALLANIGRALFLVWIAGSYGIPSTERWHDFTGYSIVVLVLVASIASLRWLATGKSSAPERAKQPESPTPANQMLQISSLAIAGLACLLTIEAGAQHWYSSHEQSERKALQWSVHWPQTADAFRKLPIDDRLRAVLRFDSGETASWKVADPSNREATVQCVGYFFRWDSGRSSILRARAHRPDICLPSVGWSQLADYPVENLPVTNISLPFRHFEFAHGSGTQRMEFAHVFFCSDGESGGGSTPQLAGSAHDLAAMHGTGLLRYLWQLVRNGERPHAQQVLELLFLTSADLPASTADALFSGLLPQLVVVSHSDSSAAK